MQRLSFFVLTVVLLFFSYAAGLSFGRVKPLCPEDCRVMEMHLQRETGRAFLIESGVLVMAAGELKAVLIVRTPEDRKETLIYHFGPLGRKIPLE